MKYLHLYNNQTDYDNEKNTLILPSASLIEKNNHVEYNPHQYVEIAGIKWATMNVGAKSITDYGLYFQWGDIQGYTSGQTGTEEGKKKFAEDLSDYKWYDNEASTLTKYKEKGMTLALEDDAVNAAWGGSWRMPKVSDFDELLGAVDAVWTPNYQGSGVNGLLCTANDGKQLFFPACGYAYEGRVNYANENGDYWLCSLSTDDDHAYGANEFSFDIDDNGCGGEIRLYGCAVRGVWDDKQAKSIQ